MHKFYKDKNGTPFALELDGSTDYLIQKHGLMPMTHAEEIELLSPTKTLQELASAAMAQVNAEYTRRAEVLIASFPEIEQKSWPRQEKEAEALMEQGESAVTPWIDGAALNRGITRLEMAQKILHKATIFASVSGALSGIRQKHEDVVTALLEAGEASREVLSNYHWAEYWELEIGSLTGYDSEAPHD